MGNARARGTYAERKAAALAAGRTITYPRVPPPARRVRFVQRMPLSWRRARRPDVRPEGTP